MKSRITIDVDIDNQPIIKIEYSASEDVRDKLVKKFMETFGGDSRWAEFYFLNNTVISENSIYGQANSTAIVRPISIHGMIEQKKSINYIVGEHEKMIEQLGKTPEEKAKE